MGAQAPTTNSHDQIHTPLQVTDCRSQIILWSFFYAQTPEAGAVTGTRAGAA